MKTPTVFLDLDGVLADLLGHLAAAHGVTYPYTEERRRTGAGLDESAQRDLYDDEAKWESGAITTVDFWRTIPRFSWSIPLWRAVRRADRNYRILSNPGRPAFAHAAAAGKIRWCATNFDLESRRVILMREKWLLATPSSILIDDDESNIVAWEARGGRGILFPQPWNRNHAETTVDPVSWVESALTAALHKASP